MLGCCAKGEKKKEYANGRRGDAYTGEEIWGREKELPYGNCLERSGPRQ